ncbi:purine-nucleoside phosphorylase [Jatrophihabitans telluris]|uniref:Purine nucleoside phosphorylase n=1 Tax=Jatrophihabitans telluris TaxID=2038343 RepID=A0ABY4QVW3_9ACTN|nr:purine-nucleoside phosphorylase [Jatrophihabitans telluris]UQX87798.1 purine-nucleoside phosphorylase [Jatrophihabitans telluris]
MTDSAPISTASASDPSEEARAAAARLAELTGVRQHDVALVLGSGWVPAVDRMSEDAGGHVEFDNTELPGFRAAGVAGHSGKIRSLEVSGKRVLAFLGRTHYYESRDVRAVAHGVRTAAAAGCRVTVLTNACGGLRADMNVGDPVLISDSINLTWATPLVGARFVDLTDLYSKRLRALMLEIDPSLAEGVYAQFPGPQYETPAEVRMARTLGADLVGMSTVLEAIAAHAEGSEVLGISLVTNLAAGITGEPLNHEEVLAAGKAAATRAGGLLAELLARL